MLGANFELLHRSKQRHHSITSSARASNVGGTVRPSAIAVLRLMTSLYLVDVSGPRAAQRRAGRGARESDAAAHPCMLLSKNARG